MPVAVSPNQVRASQAIIQPTVIRAIRLPQQWTKYKFHEQTLQRPSYTYFFLFANYGWMDSARQQCRRSRSDGHSRTAKQTPGNYHQARAGPLDFKWVLEAHHRQKQSWRQDNDARDISIRATNAATDITPEIRQLENARGSTTSRWTARA